MELRFPAGAAPLFWLIRCIQLLFVGDGGGSGVSCGEVAAWCFGFLGFDSGGQVKILVLRGVSGDLLSVFRLVRCVVLLLAMSSVALLIWRRRCGSSRLFEFLGGLCFLLSSFLVFGLMVMRELYAGAHGCLRASRLAKSWGPTADDLFSRMACSFTMPGVRSPVWRVKVCGVVLWCIASWRRRLVLRLKKNSRVLCVISRFLEVLCVTNGCTVLGVFF
ncbi:hypothetical protein PVAP13_3NG037126 [Panicum virgatum]|uniref:Transmembrane protein n=1 Tax=Panicum virgatum TaxID=38727 RepID=A0A8T0U4A7_PANVG|nr:hypothetical protein PVAP13_3NG037126 [Panicum virgatum]